MRIDGKFMVGSDIPEGQGSVNSLLTECFDLRLSVETEESDGSSFWVNLYTLSSNQVI